MITQNVFCVLIKLLWSRLLLRAGAPPVAVSLLTEDSCRSREEASSVHIREAGDSPQLFFCGRVSLIDLAPGVASPQGSRASTVHKNKMGRNSLNFSFS